MPYQVFGVSIASEVKLPYVPVSNAPADVILRFGDVPTTLANARRFRLGKQHYHLTETQLLFDIGDSGRFLIRDGREVILQAPERIDGLPLGLFLLESVVMGALLQQRGYLLLHGGVVQDSQGAILFLGASGSGKSTTVNAYQQQGYVLLVDDICAIQLSDTQQLQIHRGAMFQRLHEDVLTDTTPYQQDITGKYIVPTKNADGTSPASINRIYLLHTSEHEHFDVQQIAPLHAISAIFEHVAYRQLLHIHQQEHLRLIASLVQEHPVYRVSRPLKPKMLTHLLAHTQNQ